MLEQTFAARRKVRQIQSPYVDLKIYGASKPQQWKSYLGLFPLACVCKYVYSAVQKYWSRPHLFTFCLENLNKYCWNIQTHKKHILQKWA